MPYLEGRHLDRGQHRLERRLIRVALQSVNVRANIGGRDDECHVRRIARVKGERRRRALGACVCERTWGGERMRYRKGKNMIGREVRGNAIRGTQKIHMYNKSQPKTPKCQRMSKQTRQAPMAAHHQLTNLSLHLAHPRTHTPTRTRPELGALLGARVRRKVEQQLPNLPVVLVLEAQTRPLDALLKGQRALRGLRTRSRVVEGEGRVRAQIK